MVTSEKKKKKRNKDKDLEGSSSSMAEKKDLEISSPMPVNKDLEGSSSSMAVKEDPEGSSSSSKTVKVYIVYYSMHGQVETLAREILTGVNSVEGVEGTLWQVPETLPAEELARLRALPKSDVPIITPMDLTEADGFLFGFPAMFGMMASPFKAFLDATESIAEHYFLASKPAGIFYSTGFQGGGRETIVLTAVTQLAHHGMIFVPVGDNLGTRMSERVQLNTGSPYGTGTDTGDDGSKQPTLLDWFSAFHQGKHTATIAKQLKEYTRFSERVLGNYW